MNQFLKFTLPIIGIKRLYFHLIPLVLGFIHLRKTKEMSRESYPLIGMVVISFVLAIAYQDENSFFRAVQFLLLVSFFDFSKKYFIKNKIIDFLYIPAIFASLIFVYDLFIKNFTPANKYFLGFHITERYWGIVSEPNYSAAALGTLFLICLYYNKRSLALIYLILCIPNMSRNIAIMLIIFSFFALINKYCRKMLKPLAVCFLSFSFVLPIYLGVLDQKLKEPERLKISLMTSERSDLYGKFNTVFLSYPFGIGLGNGASKLKEKNKAYSFYKDLEQHSLMIQVLSELGIIGFLLWIIFLIRMIINMPLKNITYFVGVISLYLFINGLFDPLIYLAFGLFGDNDIKES